MGIYQMYFEDDFFKAKVDAYVIKHMTTYAGAFNCIEIKEAYERRLKSYFDFEHRRDRQ